MFCVSASFFSAMSWLRILFRLAMLLANAAMFAIAARRFDRLEMGIWSLASAMTTFVLSLDFGVANSVRNELVIARDRKQVLFQAAMWVTLMLGLLYAAMALAALFVAPGSLGARGGRLQVAIPYLALVVVPLAVRLPCVVGMLAYFSFNEPNRYAFFEFLSMFLGVVAALAALLAKQSLASVLMAFYIVGTIVNAAALVAFMRRRKWKLLTSKWRDLWGVFARAWPFGLQQVVGLGLGNAPGLVVGTLVGVENVTGVRALMIVGQTVLSLHLAHAMPLWTQCTEMIDATHNSSVFRQLRRRLLQEAVGLCAVFVAVAVTAPVLVNYWVGQPVTNITLSASLCMWALGVGIGNLYSLVLNGRDRPLLTMAALIPGTTVTVILARPLSSALGSVGVGLAFAFGSMTSAMIMMTIANREISKLLAHNADATGVSKST